MIGRILQQLAALPLWADWMIKLTAILLLGWVAQALLRQRNPRWRVALWRGLALGLILAPALTILAPPLLRIAVERPAAAPAMAPAAEFPETLDPAQSLVARRAEHISNASPVAMPAIERDSRVDWIGRLRAHGGPLLTALWALVAAGLALRLVQSWRAVRRIVKVSAPAPDSAREVLDSLAARLGCRHVPALRISAIIPAPFLCGAFRPVIILPEKMAAPDYREELPAILAHELAHTRSRDVLWGGLLHALQVALWFHPLAWRMRAAHAAACEEVCDAVAAGVVGDALSYSGTLARVALEMNGVGLAALGGLPMARAADVRRRITFLKERIYSMPIARKWMALAALAGLLVVSGIAGIKVAPAEEVIINTQPTKPPALPKAADASGARPSLPRGAKVEAGRVIRLTLTGPNDLDFNSRAGTEGKMVIRKTAQGRPYVQIIMPGCTAWRIENERWDTIVEEMRKNVNLRLGAENRTGTFGLPPDQNPYPQTWLVETAKGQTCVVRIQALDEKTWGVKLVIGMIEQNAVYGRPQRTALSKINGNTATSATQARVEQTLQGTIQAPDGKPVAGAEVILCDDPGGSYVFQGNSRQGDIRDSRDIAKSITTGVDGKFIFKTKALYYTILVRHSSGMVLRTEEDFKNGAAIALPAWGRVTGVALEGTRPKPDAQVQLYLVDRTRLIGIMPHINYSWRTRTDAQGRFAIERLPVGTVSIGIMIRKQVEIRSGETTRVQLGGTGRAITGRIVATGAGAAGYKLQTASGYIMPADARRQPPPEIYRQGPAAYERWRKEWEASPEGRKALVIQNYDRQFNIEADGSFRIPDFIAGKYSLAVTAFAGSKAIGSVKRTLEIPEMAGGRTDVPLNLGTLELTISENPQGQEARPNANTILDPNSPNLTDNERLARQKELIMRRIRSREAAQPGQP